MNKKDNQYESDRLSKIDKAENQEGYPLYPKSEDIYETFEKESEINPADISNTKTSRSSNALRQQALDKKHNLSGKDLDVPGSELDDAQEDIGNEDEENNYYSLSEDNQDIESVITNQLKTRIMLSKAKTLGKFKLRGKDGEIGSVKEFYFDRI